jgi:uncharacterized damage-inducible protein DinB
MSATAVITKEALLQHWMGHRKLTRKTIEKFPEKDLFEFSIGGMRTFADQMKEIISLAVPGLQEMASGEVKPFDHDLPLHTKAHLLDRWDADTPKITAYFNQIAEERYQDTHKLFGMFENTILNQLLYLVENEIHHRSQGFVYLRALGIEPPFFWDRF